MVAPVIDRFDPGLAAAIGSGTTLGSLAAGVPLVICPLFADQPRNGQAIERAGAGVVAPFGSPAPGALRSLGPEHVAPLQASIEHVLATPAYRRAAERIAAEIADTPTIDEVVDRRSDPVLLRRPSRE